MSKENAVYAQTVPSFESQNPIARDNRMVYYVKIIWFNHLLQFMGSQDINIKTKDYFSVSKQRKNDKFIIQKRSKLTKNTGELIQ